MGIQPSDQLVWRISTDMEREVEGSGGNGRVRGSGEMWTVHIECGGDMRGGATAEPERGGEKRRVHFDPKPIAVNVTTYLVFALSLSQKP